MSEDCVHRMNVKSILYRQWPEWGRGKGVDEAVVFVFDEHDNSNTWRS